MASFNISKGLEASLPSTKTDGKMYFCTDTGNIYIDYKDGNNILRKLVNKQILDAKQNAITGAASTITSSNLTANRILLSNSSGKVAASSVTDTELSYLDGVTSNIQTQLDSKLSKSGGELTGNITLKADASGSPSIIFQRGTSSDAYTDWRVQDSVGQLKFGTRSNSSDFTDKITFREAGNIEATSFIGNLTGNADTATNADKLGNVAASGYVKRDNGSSRALIATTGSDTALAVKGASATDSFIAYMGSDDSFQGFIGVVSGVPTFYKSGNQEIITSKTIGSQSVNHATTASTITQNVTNNKDVNIWKVYSDNDGEYGFRMQYNASGSGNNNSLSLIADNQNGTEVNAMTMLQDGTTTFAKKITASGGITGNLTGNASSATKATQDGSGNTITSTYATKTQVSNCYDSTVSRTANTVLAAPNGSAGSATFRKLVVADLPTVSIAKGGTGATTAAAALTNLGITATAAELNKLDGVTASTTEINKLKGLTPTTTELNYVDGVTSAIQTQLNSKQASITGAATTITSSNLTASRALVSNSSGKVAVSAVTSTELGYLDGVTSAIQTQLNGKAASSHTHSIANVSGLQSALYSKLPRINGTGQSSEGRPFTWASGFASVGDTIGISGREDNYYCVVDSVNDLYIGQQVNGATNPTWVKAITTKNIGDQTVYHASSAGLATKATQDASGNTITSTYATKTELTNGLAGKANTSHTHTKSQITDFPTSMPASDVYSWAKASSKPSYSWSEITSKPSSFTPASHTHISLKGNTDNRSVATTPNDYNAEFKVAGLKQNNIIGSPSSDTYSGVVGFRQWSDNSGGNAHELAFNDSGLFMRSGASTAWGSWEKFITSANIGSQSVNYATNASAVTIKRSSSNDYYPMLLTNKGDGSTEKNDNIYASGGNIVTMNPSTGAIKASKFEGNASTATKLVTARTISLTGDVTGSATFDGSANASITATVADDSHNHTKLHAIYTANGGAQPPSYVGTHSVKCNMMDKFTGTNITSFGSYADVLMMNAYSWSDVPYATALAIQKTNGVPRAWIAAGGNTDKWAGATELITRNNIGSQSVNYATSAGSVAWGGVSGKPSSFTPSTHNQPASTITAGTLAGQVNAFSTAMANVGTKQVRDIYAGTSDMTAGSSALTSGTIYLVYE